ncbi:MAG: LamG-like jellyroll fold domain-containing protein [Chitinophagaceae bacterium]
MKQMLLLLTFIACSVCTIYSQNQGYSWTFGAASPFVSTPAMTGSTGSHTLTLLGGGAPAITVVSDSLAPLGASCTGAINVGEYGAPPGNLPFGLQFDNNTPQFVYKVYTIEMAVKFTTAGNYHKLVGFSNIAAPLATNDDGIYITPDPGRIVFRLAGAETYIGPTDILPDVWHHIVFTRDTLDKITYYLDGVLEADYDDAAEDFVTQAANANAITFFKDDDTGPLPFEDDAGSIAKLSIYNRVLTEAEINDRTFNNICNTAIVLAANPNQGQQWTFPNPPPFISVAAIAGSDSTYLLDTIGVPTATITTGTTEAVGLGTSCTTPVDIAAYPLNSGLIFFNSPRYIYDTYTIELAINFDVVDPDSTRLLSFYDLGGAVPSAVYGIYVTPTGDIDFYNGASNVINPGTAPIVAATWYHLVFVRDTSGVISYYQNGILIGTFTDTLNQFIPQASTGNDIFFFKDDDGTNETSGKFAKIGIFNAVLSVDDVVERFDNICNTALVILPVNLTSFTATKSGKQVQLKWVTASEQNNLGFEVQRSSNGSSYSGIGFVNGNGTTSQQNTYYFTDQSPLAGKNYYRLKQIDIDNRVTYSALRIINMDAERQEIQLYPNPSRSLITITNIKAGNQLSVFNSNGNLVIRKIAGSGQESISVEKLAAGVYMLQVTDSDNIKRTIRFTKF